MSRYCLATAALAYAHRPPAILDRHREWLLGRVGGRVLELSPRTVDRLRVAPASIDTIVSSMTLCCTADPPATVRALAAALAPGGSMLVLEHVVGVGMAGLLLRGMAPFAAAGAGCRPDLDLASVLRDAGLDLVEVSRFSAHLMPGMPVPFLAGVARLRAGAGHAPASPVYIPQENHDRP